MPTAARPPVLPLLILLSSAPPVARAGDDPPAKVAKDLGKHHLDWLEDRALGRLASLEASKERSKTKQKGSKAKRYVFKSSAVERVYLGNFPPELRKALDKKAQDEWLADVLAAQRFVGESVILKEPKLEAVVVHRDCATAWWSATGLALGHGYHDDEAARVSEQRRREEHRTVWARAGRKWYLGVRRTPMPKWLAANVSGDALRPAPAGFDEREPSVTAIKQRSEAVEDELEAKKATGSDRRVRMEQLDAELAETRTWDVGRVLSSAQDGPHVVLRIQVGQVEVKVQSEERHNFDAYQGLAAGAVVLFRGRYVKALTHSLVLIAEAPDGEPAVRRAPE